MKSLNVIAMEKIGRAEEIFYAIGRAKDDNALHAIAVAITTVDDPDEREGLESQLTERRNVLELERICLGKCALN